MLRLEDVQRIFIEYDLLDFFGSNKDEKFLKVVFTNACQQYDVKPTEVNIILRVVNFGGVSGKIVHFETSSSYISAEKLDKVIKRVYKRLYKTRSKHTIKAYMPDETRPVKFEVLVAEWDIHKLKSHLET